MAKNCIVDKSEVVFISLIINHLPLFHNQKIIKTHMSITKLNPIRILI